MVLKSSTFTEIRYQITVVFGIVDIVEFEDIGVIESFKNVNLVLQ